MVILGDEEERSHWKIVQLRQIQIRKATTCTFLYMMHNA